MRDGRLYGRPSLAAHFQSGSAKVCIINTGGTISCVGEPLAPMTAEDFAAASKKILDPILAEQFPDTVLTYDTTLKFPESSTGTLDSTNLQPKDWCLMAQFILDNYARFDGFVILHGTDSMDFTGAALPFLLNVFDSQGFATAALSKPVVITGSQVPMYYEPPKGSSDDLKLNFNTDAFQNFCGAVACAQSGIPEVCVYFDSTLFRGNRVLKMNASQFRAFGSPNYPELAQYGIRLTQFPERTLPGPVHYSVSLDDEASRKVAQEQLSAIQNEINSHPVMQFNAFPAFYSPKEKTAWIADLLESAMGQGVKGLVLESYGEGNFPSGNPDSPEEGAIYKVLEQANRNGTVIIDSTQVIAGTVNDSAYAAGAWLPKVGALSALDMTPMTALAKSTILLSAAGFHGWSLEQVKTLLQLDLAGEMLSLSRLDSRQSSVLLPGQSLSALDGSATLINDPISGPWLQGNDGEFLWGPFGSIQNGKPGWLVMQNDGNLVLRSSYNEPLWASDTGISSGASSVLQLTGSYAEKSLVLSVFNYSAQTMSVKLFSQT